MGFTIKSGYEIDEAAVSVYRDNCSSEIVQFDLAESNPVLPTCDVIIAGPPCQGFSNIGKMNDKDPRNSLLQRTCDIAIAARPKILIIENVMGLVSKRNFKFLNNAVSQLSSNGYYVEVLKIECEKFGLPQRRKRIFLIARLGLSPFQPHLPKEPLQTVGNVLNKVVFSSNASPPLLLEGSRAKKIAERIGPGQKLCNVRGGANSVHTWEIPEVFGATTPAEIDLLNRMIKLRRTGRKRNFGDADAVSISRIEQTMGGSQTGVIGSLLRKKYLKKVGDDLDLVNTFNGTFRRLALNDVSPTVDTQFGNPRMFLHPKEHRGMAAIEASALQGFPPSFRWTKNDKTNFRLIGNAVPPPIAEKVAQLTRGLLA